MIEDALAGLKTDDALLASIRKATARPMTPAEEHAQRRSWVIGQVGCTHPDLPREKVEALVDHAMGTPPEQEADIPLREAVAAIIHPEAFRQGHPAYYGPDFSIAWSSAGQRIALNKADKILALVGAHVCLGGRA